MRFESTNQIRFGFYGNDLDSSRQYSQSRPIHITVVGRYNGGTDMKQKMYINGLLENSRNLTSYLNMSSQVMKIGSRWDNAYPLNAYIQDLRVYNTELSDQEIFEIYSKGNHLHLQDDGRYNMTLQAYPSSFPISKHTDLVGPVYADCLNFDGSSYLYSEVNNYTVPNTENGNAISFWLINRNSSGNDDNDRIYLSGSLLTDGAISFQVLSGTNINSIDLNHDDGVTNNTLPAYYLYDSYNWAHYCIIYHDISTTSTAGALSLYKNGILIYIWSDLPRGIDYLDYIYVMGGSGVDYNGSIQDFKYFTNEILYRHDVRKMYYEALKNKSHKVNGLLRDYNVKEKNKDNILYDNSINKKQIQLNAGVSFSKFTPIKKYDYSLYLDGTNNGYFELDNTLEITKISYGKEFTIHFWVYIQDNSNTPYIISNRLSGATGDSYITLQYDTSNNRFQLDLSYFNNTDASPTTITINSSTNSIYYNRWYFVSIIFTNNNNVAGLVVNDTFYDDYISSNNHISNRNYLYPAVDNRTYYIGKYNNSSSNNLKGYICDLKIFDNPIPIDYLQSIYKKTIKSNIYDVYELFGKELIPYLSVYMKLDNNTNDAKVINDSPSIIPFTAYNSPTFTSGDAPSNTLYNNSYYFDGTNNYIQSNDSIVGYATDMTISFWAKKYISSFASNRGLLYTSPTDADVTDSFFLTARILSTDYVSFGVRDDQANLSTYKQSSVIVNDTDWHHYTFTFRCRGEESKIDNVINFYFDGKYSDTFNVTSTYKNQVYDKKVNYDFGRDNSSYFYGYITGIVFIDKILTPEEIYNILYLQKPLNQYSKKDNEVVKI
jgi:hypothetical protein